MISDVCSSSDSSWCSVLMFFLLVVLAFLSFLLLLLLWEATKIKIAVFAVVLRARKIMHSVGIKELAMS